MDVAFATEPSGARLRGEADGGGWSPLERARSGSMLTRRGRCRRGHQVLAQCVAALLLSTSRGTIEGFSETVFTLVLIVPLV